MQGEQCRPPLFRLTVVSGITLLCAILTFWGPESFGLPAAQALTAPAKPGAFTPPPGSAERQAILEALRQKLESLHQIKMVLPVKYLKVHQNWAWIQVQPRSPDGTGRYEDVHALLQKKAGCWQVAEIACTEEDNPDCLGAPNYFKKLRARFPGAPADIFPGPVP